LKAQLLKAQLLKAQLLKAWWRATIPPVRFRQRMEPQPASAIRAASPA
jgi:hypothetical protein